MKPLKSSESHLKRCKQYRENHPDRVKESYKMYLKNHPNYESTRWKRYYYNGNGWYTNLRANAKRRGILFNVTQEEFDNLTHNEERCCYCGITQKELDKLNTSWSYKFNHMTIDRKDNTKGYNIDNMAVCCHKCNLIKGNEFSYDDMMILSKSLKELLRLKLGQG